MINEALSEECEAMIIEDNHISIDVTICYDCVGNEERGDSETVFINPHWVTQGSQESHTQHRDV